MKMAWRIVRPPVERGGREQLRLAALLPPVIGENAFQFFGRPLGTPWARPAGRKDGRSFILRGAVQRLRLRPHRKRQRRVPGVRAAQGGSRGVVMASVERDYPEAW